jgi:L-alanine-DL-glutamate epimerase-like enolase superfamily enzyme
MSKPTDIRIVDVQTGTERIQYRAPIKFGGRVVSDAVIVNVSVDVETRDGRRATGGGSMPMGNTWAWPSKTPSGDQTLAAMLTMGKHCVKAAAEYAGWGHPLAIASDLSKSHEATAKAACQHAGVTEAMPRLAQLVAASPVEAALHDAYGKSLGRNAYDVLGPEFVGQDLSHWLGSDFRGEWLDRYTLRKPKPQMPLYHLVGALDPLTEAEISQRIGDGLPETLGEWIRADGLTHLKIKLDGADLAWDVQRVVSVEDVAREAQAARGCKEWFYSLDFNERCESVGYVLEFLGQLRTRSPQAFDRVQYIEQPTSRDLKAHGGVRMHEAAAQKPVVIDEALVDMESLLLARELGYSGVALKACKGHSEALLMAAAAQKYGMFLCVQDLTCPGASFLHSASLAARIPTIAAIEGNGRQYCPAGNRGWDERFPSMFHVTGGTVATGVLTGAGLGF